MSNLNDFDPGKDAVPRKDLEEIDRWALLRAQRLIERVRKAYEEFEFHLVFHSIHGFCVNDLSAFYFDVIKDRLYCESKSGKLRRSSQTAMNDILHTMIKLYAPILSFTAEDIWGFVNRKSDVGNRKSVFEENMPEADKKYFDKELETKWDKLLAIRGEIYKAIEQARAEKLISHPLEARVEVTADGDDHKLLKDMEEQMPSILIVSEFSLNKGEKNVVVKKAEGGKCERCWMHLRSVGGSKDHPTLCERCSDVVDKMV
jgi:isoleucyl-tRNA synthetase